MIFTVTDDAGSTAVVFVAWVEFGDRDAARRFKELEDVHGTGDITPLTGALVQVKDVPFTAHNYDSDVVDGVTVVIAEAENVAGGFTAEYLDDIAGIAVRTPVSRLGTWVARPSAGTARAPVAPSRWTSASTR